jgi:hypothetical protein
MIDALIMRAYRGTDLSTVSAFERQRRLTLTPLAAEHHLAVNIPEPGQPQRVSQLPDREASFNVTR